MSKENVLIFFEAMYALNRSGINLYETLILIKQTNPRKEIQQLANIIINEIMKGNTISEALAKISYMPAFIVGALKAGEASGRLENTLKIVVDQLQMDVEMTKKIKQVTLYPKFVVITMVVALFICAKFIFPTFATMFGNQEAELPVVTKIFIAVTNFVDENYLLLGLVICALIAAGVAIKNWTYGRKLAERATLKMPKISLLYKLSKNKDMANYMGLLITSGVNLGDAVEIYRKSTSSSMMNEVLIQSNRNMVQGKFLSDTLKSSPIIIPYLLEIIKIGEKSGELGISLLRMGKYLERNYEVELRKAIAIIEPSITIVMGLLVAVMVAAIMLPMLNLVTTF